MAPESSVLDVPRISRVSLYKVCKSRRYKLKLVEVWIASSLPHQLSPFRWYAVLFKSGERAVETKLLKLVLFIVDGIGAIDSRVWMHKVRVWRAHREVIRLFLSIR